MHEQPHCPGFFFLLSLRVLPVEEQSQRHSYWVALTHWRWRVLDMEENYLHMLFCLRPNDLLLPKSLPYFTVYVYVCLCVNMHVHPCIHIASAGTCKNRDGCQMSSLFLSTFSWSIRSFFMCMGVLSLCICTVCMPGTHSRQKRVLGPL